MIVTAIGAGLAAVGGAIGSMINNKKKKARAQEFERNNNFNYWANAGELQNIKNAGLRQVENNIDRQNAAINNSAIQSEATFENQLAAKKNAGDIYAGAVNQENANIGANMIDLRNKHLSGQIKAADMYAELAAERANNWYNLGSNLSQSLINYGLTNIGKPKKDKKTTSESRIDDVMSNSNPFA
jgi:hypothetical protein